MNIFRATASLLLTITLVGLDVHAQLLSDHQRWPIQNAKGEVRYTIYLNEAKSREEDASREAPPRAPMAFENRTDFRGWHRPTVRALVKRLESKYHLDATSMTGWALPTFSAFISDATLEVIRRDPAVDSVEIDYRYASDFAAWGPWTDTTFHAGLPDEEVIGWGKQAIGTNDALTSPNRTYIVDSYIEPHRELNGVWEFTGVNDGWSTNSYHGTHVAGIMAAKSGINTGAMNGNGVRGINPSVNLVSVLKQDENSLTAYAFDWLLYDAEWRHIYPVVNLSSAQERFGPGVNGAMYRYLKRISSRVLLVQSAGNFGTGNCDVSYAVGNPHDGIVVVGGVDKSGARAEGYDNRSSIVLGISPGSNWGPCVEAWAPSVEVLSTWPSPGIPDGAYQVLGGTSMAAPHVSSLAARYGSNFITWPVEREQYIHAVESADWGIYADS